MKADQIVEAKSWNRMWRMNLLVFGGYLVLFIIYYYWLYSQIEPSAFFQYKQRQPSRYFLIVAGIHLFTMIFVHRRLWMAKFRAFFFEKMDPYPLALARMALFATIAIHLVYYVPEHWQALAELPIESRQPLSFAGWLVNLFPASAETYRLVTILGAIFGMMAALGLFSRFSMLIMIPIVFYIFGLPQFYGKLSHYQFLFWVTIIFAFSPAGLHWSLDGFINRIRGKRISNLPRFDYGLPIKLMMLTLAGIYFFSGFRKLYEIGFFWALSDNPVNLLRTEWLESFNDVPLIRIDLWPSLCSFGALGVILFELAYPFLLLSKKSRIWAAIDVMLFHTLNGYFLNIDFIYLKTAHLSYFDINYWRKLILQNKWPIIAWLVLIAAMSIFGYSLGALILFPVVQFAAIFNIVMQRIPKRKRISWIWAIRSKLPAFLIPKNKNYRPSHPIWRKLNLVTGIILIALNYVFGAFGIHSWPISSYPSYSFVRNSTIEYGWFLPEKANGQKLDLDEESLKQGFRKENILPIAERIVYARRWAPNELKQSVLHSWERWLTEVPSLKTSAKAKAVIREFSIDPDQKGKIVNETMIGWMLWDGINWKYDIDTIARMP